MDCRVPQFIKFLKEERHISQAQIACDLQVSPSAISSWCTGRRSPSYRTIERISQIYGVKVSWLTGSGESCDTPPESDDEQEADELDEIMKGQHPAKIALVRAVAQLSDNDVRAIWRVVDLLYQYRHSVKTVSDLRQLPIDDEIIEKTLAYFHEITRQ